MAFALTTYRPFDCTRALIAKVDESFNRWKHIAAKVAVIALAVLTVIPILALDLILSAATGIIRLFKPQVVAAAPVPTRPIHIGRPILQLRICPQGSIYSSWDRNDKGFLKEAIQEAMSFLDGQTKATYEELQENQGVLESGEEPPIEIFQWMAAVLLVHHIRSRFDTITYPKDVERTRLNNLKNIHYKHLTDGNKVNALYKIIYPEWDCELSEPARNFVNLVNGFATELTRRQDFLQLLRNP